MYTRSATAAAVQGETINYIEYILLLTFAINCSVGTTESPVKVSVADGVHVLIVSAMK